MSTHFRWWIRTALASLLLVSCGGDSSSSSGQPTTEPAAPPPAPTGPLLEESGELADADPADARGRYDRYFVDVGAGDRLLVTLTSSAFDPILEVTPPGTGTLVNDDWQGDRTRSQLELLASEAGSMKIEVRAYANQGGGAYHLEARRVAAGGTAGTGGDAASVPVLSAGDGVDGEIAPNDHALSGGSRFDTYVVRAQGPLRVTIRPRGGAAPRTTFVNPDGEMLQATHGVYDAPDEGSYRLQVIGAEGLAYRVEVAQAGDAATAPLLARAHHQFNELLNQLRGTPRQSAGSGSGGAGAQGTGAPGTGPAADPSAVVARPLPVRVGDRLNGNLAENDARLPSGEYFDVYELVVAQPEDAVAITMESATLDCFLRVDGPNAQHWENDDYGGTLSSRVDVMLDQPGTYRIVTTSYRPGDTGPYELKVLAQRDAAVPGSPPVAANGPEQRIEGTLAAGDSQLQSGEFFDDHTFTWPAGAFVHLEAQSTDFDSYLIVHPPTGSQRDNDDMTPGSLNAGMDLQVTEAGAYRVSVTSYRPGETGAYALVVRGAEGAPSGTPSNPPPAPSPPIPTPTPGSGSRVETGALAQGDQTLSSGEFVDAYPMTFTPRSAVSIRLESSDFDTYLIVRSPSGNQEDNDDFVSGSLNSGFDIPVAEPGQYRVSVTSYRPGETGSYRLTVTEGASIVDAPPSNGPTPNRPPNGGGTAPPASGGGRVWGLFAGITDYPGQVNDLPECANDARKLAEAVRNQGNMPQDQEFVFTDSQATTGNIRQAMQTIASRIRPDDVLVFFYSGHGGQTDRSTDRRELDARDEYLFVYDGQLLDDDLGHLFDAIHARVALVAIDACFAGGFAKDVITQPGRVGMFSSEEDVTSAVADRFQAGGYLSHFLRLGINGEADSDPRNEILTVGELTHYTWRQFGQQAADVRMSMGYQHLVVDRGAVHTTEVLWAVHH